MPAQRPLSWLLVPMQLLCLAAMAGAEPQRIELFDGRTLDGWTTADGRPVTSGWTVEDGMLVRSGPGGSIFTSQEFGDFELSFEWKIGHRGNSGIKYRVAHYDKGVYGKPAWLGCEYQIFGDKPESLSRFSTGAIYELYAPSGPKKLRAPGQFNEGRIVVDGSQIEHWLNGTRIVQADTSSADWKKRVAESKFNVVRGFFENRRGRIELQDHGHKVWFRNILLTPLGDEPQKNSAAKLGS